MSNADLIERVSNFAPREVVGAVADALEAADKRIAELEALLQAAGIRPKGKSVAGYIVKLAVAREALNAANIALNWREFSTSAEECNDYHNDARVKVKEALAQIGEK